MFQSTICPKCKEGLMQFNHYDDYTNEKYYSCSKCFYQTQYLHTYKTDMTAPLENEIRKVCDEIANFLVEKNKAYGNSAAEPAGIFAKRLDTLAQIDVRIDDKLNRIQKGNEYPGDDTIKDLIGYLILRTIVKEKIDE